MKNEEKQALIKFCNTVVSDIKSDAVAHEDEVVMSTLQVFEIALAALTAQPDYWQQRAEAAEARASNLNDGWLNAIGERDEARAKLAELEKQDPTYEMYTGQGWMKVSREYYDGVDRSRATFRHVFTRPAPAISLAELMPDGWRLVPIQPTAVMYEAGDQQLATKQVWDAMLAAAPEVE